MYVKYVCAPGALLPHSEEDVIRIDVENELPLLEAFFGVKMPEEDRDHFVAAFRRGLQEDYGVVADGALVARAVVMNFESGVSEIGCAVTHPSHRNRGRAKRAVGRRAASLRPRGKTVSIPTTENAPMRAVFEALGFTGIEIEERELPS